MLAHAIGGLVPSAVAVALSPVPIVAIVLVLSARHARSAGIAFAAGWILGLAALSTLVVLLLGSGVDRDVETGIEWFKVAIGVIFLAMAAQQWRKRPGEGKPAAMPEWMDSIQEIGARRAYLLGLGLSAANPKNLALTLTASASIAEANLDPRDTVLAIVAFVAIGSVTVAGSVLLFLASPERAARPLSSVGRFMAENGVTIMMVVLLLLGAKLIGDGLGGIL